MPQPRRLSSLLAPVKWCSALPAPSASISIALRVVRNSTALEGMYAACVVVSLLLLMSLLTFAYGALFTPDVFAGSLPEQRIPLVAFCFVVACTNLVVLRSKRFVSFMGPIVLERYVMVHLSVLVPLCALINPTYLPKILGSTPLSEPIAPERAHHYAGMAMLLIAYVTTVHTVIAVRWSSLWLLEFMALLSFIVPVFFLGLPVPLFYALEHFTIYLVTIGVSSLGKRQSELGERESFSRVAAERTLRCIAERKAESRPIAAPKQSESSIPTTSPSAMLFRPNKEADPEEYLQGVENLGKREGWYIPGSDMRCVPGVILGRGGFGFVVPALYHGASVVVKAPLSSARSDGLTHLLNVAQELRIFRHLRHPNIVLFYGAVVEPQHRELLLVLERIDGSVLEEYLQWLEPSAGEAQRIKLAQDVASALSYLHAQAPPIIHGDLKASNVMVEWCSVWPNAKLIDFGLSRLMTSGARPVGGTKRWMAPEILMGSRSPRPSLDIFSFGLLLNMLITGQQPCIDMPYEDFVSNLLRGMLPLEWLDGVPLQEECQALCESCLQLDPQMRPSMVEVLSTVQGMLSDLVPLDAYFGLGEAQRTPGEMGIKHDLTKARQAIRRLGAGASSRVASGGRALGDASLTHDQLHATSLTGKVISMIAAMSSWNSVERPGSCCHFHSMVSDAQNCLATMRRCRCKSDLAPGKVGQCRRCGLILCSGTSVPGNQICLCVADNNDDGHIAKHICAL
mmetsp:Transcript_99029/g.319258  ORF Transcript_99029/g.319258 Transcript_99029/m.319258 type:complete len:739 (+) Transcript_99029:84-2300(+)